MWKRSVVIMDNASYHISKRTRELTDLPAYSPDLNEIEKYWAILKKKVKKYCHLVNFLQNLQRKKY